MTRTLFFSSLLLLCFACFTANAQVTTTHHTDIDVQVTQAQRVGKTLPVRQIIPRQLDNQIKRNNRKKNKQVPPNQFGTRSNQEPSDIIGQPNGPDPVLQESSGRDDNIVVEPLVNVMGLGFDGPPDPTGDVGQDHYVQAINATTIEVFDKEGNSLSVFGSNDIWSSIGQTGAGDPIILYDQEVDRWLITEFTFPGSNMLMIAISEDSDPLGSYTAYQFGAPSFPDYPKYGIWGNAYTVCTNEQGPSTMPIYLIDRQAIIDGEATADIQRITIPGVSGGPGIFVSAPVDWSGLIPPATEHPMAISLNDDAWGEVSEDQIDLHTIMIDWDNPNNTSYTTTSLITAPYDTDPCPLGGGQTGECFPQGGTGGPLNGISEVIMNQVHYRNFQSHESIVLCLTVDATGTNIGGIRWMELRRMPGADWTVYQEGTYAPDDGLHRYVPSIAMDGGGNIALGYSVTGEDVLVDLRFTGRRASDPLGEMTVQEYVLGEGSTTIPFFRFGDYAHMTIDPTNDRTFWFTGEYGANNTGATRVAAFDIRRDTTDLAPTAIISPENSPDLTDSEVVKVEVKNVGLDTQSVFWVGYIFEGGMAVADSVNFELYPDSTYSHTFTPTVDMSIVGDYQFKIFTVLDGDQAIFNDTLRAVVSKLPRFDAGITSIEGIDGTICADSTLADLELTNFGTELLTSVTIIVELNGGQVDSILWEGELASGASTLVSVLLPGLMSGDNLVSAVTSNPSGMQDEIMANDGFSRNVTALTDGVPVFLELLTDDYPNETTWELADEGGNIIYTGGPYDQTATLFTEEWCLDPEACYTFTLFDSYGDGICCGFGLGNYRIVDADGIPLLESTGEFGSQETNDFCATFVCMLAVDVEVSPESSQGATDGSLMLFPINGMGPFQYSIDGGTTFQESGLFTDLPAGNYEIVITGAADCLFEATATVSLCALEAMVSVVNESTPNANDGEISITASNDNGGLTYSINGGQSFQINSVFTGLGANTYDIVVQDALGCTVETTATVDILNSIKEFTLGYTVELFPNPTKGVFQINVNGVQKSSQFLGWEIFDSNGKLIQTGNLTKYNGIYTGMLSLFAYPNGIYFVRFVDRDIDRMVRVVKE